MTHNRGLSDGTGSFDFDFFSGYAVSSGHFLNPTTTGIFYKLSSVAHPGGRVNKVGGGGGGGGGKESENVSD